MKRRRPCGYRKCAVELALDVIGGKWKPMLLLLLLESPRRYGELRRCLPGVTQRMLTLQLRELEADGMVHRAVFAEVPSRVEYSVTELGRTLSPLLTELRRWGEAHAADPPGRRLAAQAPPASPATADRTTDAGRGAAPTPGMRRRRPGSELGRQSPRMPLAGERGGAC